MGDTISDAPHILMRLPPFRYVLYIACLQAWVLYTAELFRRIYFPRISAMTSETSENS
jgi:hypothetical protein